ncbi:response regulator [Leeia aquatica]|uniref:Response regulator n=1 Tax=Leeia aquatica TaxID=2725557 RepID=A0A847RX15_9NEIS|nr:response regulator [Leeia aquatica]NLR75700.1 response regulator [Leeia aquatica]
MNLDILLVEDDDVAAEAVLRSLRKYNLNCTVVLAEDGQVALDILRGQHPERSIKRPMLVLLDLNMPRLNGFEFLEETRNDPDLSNLIVFILTTSDADTDKTRAYHHHVAGYMVKSAVGPQFSRLARLLDEYHGSVSVL